MEQGDRTWRLALAIDPIRQEEGHTSEIESYGNQYIKAVQRCPWK